MKKIFALILFLGLVSPSAFPAEMDAAKGSHRFKVIQTANPVYPARMLNDGVSSGVAKIILHVNSQGTLVDSLVVAYTRQSFADEVLRVVKKWKFEPEVQDGEAIDTILELTFNFEVNGVLLVQRYGCDIVSLDLLQGFEYKACSLKNLDRVPAPVSIVRPTYPKEWSDKGVTGKVSVEFYIDESGAVRFPSVRADANRMLAGIAVAAVSQWKFMPPTQKGKPVLVHAQQDFDFR